MLHHVLFYFSFFMNFRLKILDSEQRYSKQFNGEEHLKQRYLKTIFLIATSKCSNINKLISTLIKISQLNYRECPEAKSPGKPRKKV